jgi:oligosaccharide reducing-end xylanase
MKKIPSLLIIVLISNQFIIVQTTPAFYSWRVPMNIAMDYNWFGKDATWQKNYAKRFQAFLQSKGINTFDNQFNTDGSKPDIILPAGGYKKLRHSLGSVATAASTEIIHKDNFDFVHAIHIMMAYCTCLA